LAFTSWQLKIIAELDNAIQLNIKELAEALELGQKEADVLIKKNCK